MSTRRWAATTAVCFAAGALVGLAITAASVRTAPKPGVVVPATVAPAIPRVLKP